MTDHRLVMYGDVPDHEARTVMAFAKAHGYTVTRLPMPDPLATTVWTAEELAHVDPLSDVEPDLREDYEKALGSLGVASSADLTKLTFEQFMRPEAGVYQPHWKMKAAVLDFMIKHRICFSDLDPTIAFPTYVGDDSVGLDTRTIACLLREGLSRLELLVYATEYDLTDKRRFGVKSLGKVKIALASLGLRLKQH